MKTLFRAGLASLALTLALPACAQTSKPVTPPTTNAHPALWVVRDHDTTIYLFGTIHVLKPGLDWFDQAVKTAFDKSGQVMLEITKPDPTAMQQLVLQKGVLPPGSPALSSQLAPDKRDELAKAAASLGTPVGTFDRLRPWLVAVQLSVLPLEKQGFSGDNGPESVITAAAKTAGKPVAGLETAEQQIGFFDQLSEPAQLQFLSSTLDDLPKLDTEMATMIDAWSKGEPDRLAALLNEDLGDSPEVAKVLLYDRNQRWAAWIRNRMAKPGTVFIAVGAGHLAGSKSVIADLQAMHVRVTRVKY